MVDTRTYKEKIQAAKNRTFTLSEAIEFERELNKGATMTKSYKWVNSQGDEVVVGSNT